MQKKKESRALQWWRIWDYIWGRAAYIEELSSCISKKKLLGYVAKNYTNLDIHMEDWVDDIRVYMTQKVRKIHLSVLEKERIYCNVYMFKLYHRYIRIVKELGKKLL